MRDDFELHGQGSFQPALEHSQQGAVFFTGQMTLDPLPKDSLERQAWQSTWQEAGWLEQNPLVSPDLKAAAVALPMCVCMSFNAIADRVNVSHVRLSPA